MCCFALPWPLETAKCRHRVVAAHQEGSRVPAARLELPHALADALASQASPKSLTERKACQVQRRVPQVNGGKGFDLKGICLLQKVLALPLANRVNRSETFCARPACFPEAFRKAMDKGAPPNNPCLDIMLSESTPLRHLR
eukprot:4008269-Amphidinium_carterae.1